MRYDECGKYFDIYTMNEDKVQMIIALNDNGNLIGRALLWKTDQGLLFCDRIYGSDITIEGIKKYAKEKLGAVVKYQQTYSDKRYVNNIGEICNNELTVTLYNPKNWFPYMDTMKFTDDIDEDEITLSNTDRYNIELSETNGGTSYDSDDWVTLYDGERVHIDSATYVESRGEYYYTDDVVYSDNSDTYILIEEAVMLNGEYFHEEDDEICWAEDTEEYELKDNCYYSDFSHCWLENPVECPINGFIFKSDSKEIVIGGNIWEVHEDVEVIDLAEAGLITTEEALEYVEE
jgi:hypothetical protein